MKKIIPALLIIFGFILSFSAFSQSNVSVGPEQKVKAEMKVPAAVRPGSEFTVIVKITKGSTSGLGRFQQFIPKGMMASQMENDGADFSFENQNVKFIWLALPLQETMTIKYKIATEASLNTTKTLSGTFSYVENGRTKNYSLVPKEIIIDAKAPVEEPVTENTKQKPEPPKGEAAPVVMETKPEVAPTPVETKPEEEKVIAEQAVVIPNQKPDEAKAPTAPPKNEKVLDKVTEKKEPIAPSLNSGTSATAGGITFRVQIAAMNEKHFRKDGHFQKKFGIEQTVYTEEHEGLKKYSVGTFSTYNTARSFRDELGSKVEGSFVVAYKDGVRISVAEAISLMKQK